MREGKRADLITGLGLIALATYVYLVGAAMPQVKKGLGPGGYPIFAAVGLGILGLILAVQSCLKSGIARKAHDRLSAMGAGRVILFTFMALLYSQAIPFLGFMLSSSIFLLIASYFFGYRNHLLNIICSVLLPITVFVIFRYCFLVLIPTGTIFQ